MTFAFPFFLLATLAGSIPVILHLIHRQRAREIHFSTLRFLRIAVQRTRRRRYIDDLLLLILRSAILVLLALGLARPVVTHLRALLGPGASKAVAILLDNSTSMAVVDQGRPVFETARLAATQVLDGLEEGDSAALFLSGGPGSPVEGRLQSDLGKVRQAVAQAKPCYEKADLAGLLEKARMLLSKAEAPSKEIYVLCDNQRISWEGLAPAGAEKGASTSAALSEIPVVLLQARKEPLLNASLQSIELETPAPVAGVPVQALVKVLNPTSAPQQKHVELQLDGARLAVSPTLSLPPGGSMDHRFQFKIERPGVHKGEIRFLEEDGNPLDNRLYFVITADQQVAITIVKSRNHEIPYADDAYYIERALGSAAAGQGPFRLTVITQDTLAAQPLAGQAAVICVNLNAIDDAAGKRLTDYIRGGGHVLWIAGENVQPEAYNAMNERAGKALLPAPLGAMRKAGPEHPESWPVTSLNKQYPALAPLAEPPSLYRSVLVHKQFLMNWKEGEGGTLLAGVDDGQPLLLERGVEAGSVLFLGTGLHVEWTNLPVKPLFLPLIARLLFHLSGVEAERSLILAGTPVTLPLGGGRTEPVDVEVIRPGGAILRLRGQQPDAGGVRYADTHEAGSYLLRAVNIQPERQLAFSANLDPDESDPLILSREEILARFSAEPPQYCDTLDALREATRKLREGTSLAPGFLAATLAALLLELLLSNRVRPQPQGQETEAGQPAAMANAQGPATAASEPGERIQIGPGQELEIRT